MEVRTGWASHGKQPGGFSDYEIVACSSGPGTAALYDKIVRRLSPGNPPAGAQAGGSGTPWVTFGAVTIRGEDFLCVIVRNWSGDRDGVGRPILTGNLVCLPLRGTGAAPVSLAALHRAVAGHLGGWERPDTLAGEPFALDVPDTGLDVLADRVRRFDPARVAAAAAAALDRDVAVLPGDTALGLADRLDFLDAVHAALPAGARMTFTASTWADGASKQRLRLAFTDRARKDELGMAWDGPWPEPADPSAAQYRDELLRLFDRKGVEPVLRHLAGVTAQDAAGAVDALLALDFLPTVLEHARKGLLNPDHVRRLHETGELARVPDADRLLLVRLFLDHAEQADLDLVAAHWQDGLRPHAVRLAHRLSFGAAPPEHVLAFARRFGFAQQVVDEFAAGGSALSARWLRERARAGAPEARAYLARRPAQLAGLLVELVRRSPDEAAAVADGLDLAAPETAFLRVALRGGPPARAGDVAELERLSPGGAARVLAACRQAWPEHVPLLLAGALDWLQDDVLAAMPAGRGAEWAAELKSARLPPRLQGTADALCHRLGDRPLRPPAVVLRQRPDPDYVEAFARVLRTVPAARRHRAVASVLAGPGWAEVDPQVLSTFLDGLLADLKVRDGHDEQQVRTALRDVVDRVPALGDLPRVRPWVAARKKAAEPVTAHVHSRSGQANAPRQDPPPAEAEPTRHFAEQCANQLQGWQERTPFRDIAGRLSSWGDVERLVAGVAAVLAGRRVVKYEQLVGLFARELVREYEKAHRSPHDVHAFLDHLEVAIEARRVLHAEAAILVEGRSAVGGAGEEQNRFQAIAGWVASKVPFVGGQEPPPPNGRPPHDR
ncbi:hypothetical protein [Saccharothrix xinjiangensis]|uniref:Uncharacterized protein n=1 Tax=Saccharothrix xinjiangensis TaxID=204798 RepID=A0ABV9Y8U9_9PSEU